MSPIKTNQQVNHTPDDLYFHLSDTIAFLKRQGYPIDGTNVSYYSSILSAFVNCNRDPVSDSVYIAGKDLELINGILSLRLRFLATEPVQKCKNDYDEDMSSANDEDENVEDKSDPTSRQFAVSHTFRRNTTNGLKKSKDLAGDDSMNNSMEGVARTNLMNNYE